MFDDTPTPPTVMYRPNTAFDSPTEPGAERVYLLPASATPTPAATLTRGASPIDALEGREHLVLVVAAACTLALVVGLLFL